MPKLFKVCHEDGREWTNEEMEDYLIENDSYLYGFYYFLVDDHGYLYAFDKYGQVEELNLIDFKVVWNKQFLPDNEVQDENREILDEESRYIGKSAELFKLLESIEFDPKKQFDTFKIEELESRYHENYYQGYSWSYVCNAKVTIYYKLFSKGEWTNISEDFYYENMYEYDLRLLEYSLDSIIKNR